MTKKERTPYDETNKLLFSEPQMMTDLIKGFFKDTWVENLDFSTLERMNSSFISSNKKLKKRDGDMIWKVRWNNTWVYLIIVLEFQSRVDPIMAVRMSTYTSLLYEEIYKNDKSLLDGKFLPPVLPMVLYNGEYKWTAALTLRELMDPSLSEGLLKYQPNICYWLFDEGHATLKDELAGSDNLVSLLVQLEQASEPEVVRELTNRVAVVLKKMPGAISLQRAYTVFLARGLRLKKIAPGLKLQNIVEDIEMFNDRAAKWKQITIEKGLSQGLSQGRSEGLSEGLSLGRSEGLSEGLSLGRSEGIVIGQRVFLEGQLNEKFGKLTPAQNMKLATATENELGALSRKILYASSLKEVFGEIPLNN